MLSLKNLDIGHLILFKAFFSFVKRARFRPTFTVCAKEKAKWGVPPRFQRNMIGFWKSRAMELTNYPSGDELEDIIRLLESSCGKCSENLQD